VTVGNRISTPIFLLLTALAGLASSCSSTPPATAIAQAYYDLGNSWFELKKFDKADKAYRTALSWDPKLKIAVLNLARTKAEMGDPAAALDLLEPLSKSDPDNVVVAQYNAWLLAKQQGPAAAADLYLDLAKRLPGDADTQFNAGLCLSEADRTDEALVSLRAWRALDGKSWQGLSLLATVLDKVKAPEAADVWLDAAGTFPDNDAKRFAPLAARAKDLEAVQLYGDAAKAWDTALALPQGPDQPRGEAQFRLGSLYLLKIEDYAKGSDLVIQAWKSGYHDADAWKALRSNPDLKYGMRLEADLKLAEVSP